MRIKGKKIPESRMMLSFRLLTGQIRTTIRKLALQCALNTIRRKAENNVLFQS